MEYIIIGIWVAIALLLAYIKTKKEFGNFDILNFLKFTFDYTIGFAWKILEVLSADKDNRNSSAKTKNEVITNVQFHGGFANVSIDNGRRNFSIKCNEIVNWTGQSVTIKIYNNGASTLIQTRDINNNIIDNYYE